MVHQPERIVGRIGASDGREAIRDVGLRLVHHRHDETLTPRRRRDAPQRNRRRRRGAPAAEHAGCDIPRVARVHIADYGDRQFTWREPLPVQA